jgi:hypothetical protein
MKNPINPINPINPTNPMDQVYVNTQIESTYSEINVRNMLKEIGITHSAVDSFVSSFSITHRNCFSAKPDGSLKALERVSLLNDRDDICDTFPSET